MNNVRLLFAPESIGIADRIAAALIASGYAPGTATEPAVAALVIWSPASSAAPAILSEARAALARRVLVPVALGKAPPPPSFEHLWPMDLSGWDGSVDDPRWKFVLDEIDLAVRRGVEISPAPAASPAAEVASRAAASISGARPAAASPEAETDGVAFEDIFAEPLSYSVASRPRPRVPAAALFAGFAVLGLTVGGAFIAGREASRPPAAERAAQTRPPTVAFVQPEDQPTDDTAFEKPDFPAPPAEEAPEPAGEADGEEAPGEGDADFTEEEGARLTGAAEALRDGQAPAVLDLPGPAGLSTPASSERPQPTSGTPADDPARAQPDMIAELAWEATAQAEQSVIGSYFRDCVECPDMAEIEPGLLTPDATADESAPPVMLRKRIAVAVRETTFEEWSACVADGACSARPDGGWGTGKRPVINVSWGDALAFVLWLSEKTGRAYRLPTESEWEYAARGGAPTAFSFGPAATADKANFDATRPFGGAAGAARGGTLPAASFAPNGFGLYDMHGNVAEWTADCWTGDIESVVAVNGGLCTARVIKGGAWNDGAADLRASSREGEPETASRNDIGFRVVRDLP